LNDRNANKTNSTAPAPKEGYSHWRHDSHWRHGDRKARDEFKQNRKEAAGGASPASASLEFCNSTSVILLCFILNDRHNY
jgi:hypothetical protein